MSPAESPSAESSPATAAAPPVTAVFGAGAVGCYFGARLAEAGVPVTLIGRPAHVAAIKAEGLAFESGGATRRVPIRATSDAAEGLAGAQFVMFCVKTLDTESAARQIAPLLAPGATVLSMQNGVDNAERMRSAAAVDAMAAVVYVGASMPGPGHQRHAGRGDRVIGEVGPPLAPRPGR
ncbi:MAG: ketopantoate reductase family protein, partial [Lautropia sp.]